MLNEKIVQWENIYFNLLCKIVEVFLWEFHARPKKKITKPNKTKDINMQIMYILIQLIKNEWK